MTVAEGSGRFSHVQPQPGLAFLFVRAVAGGTIAGKNRADVAVEIDRFDGLERTGEKQHDQPAGQGKAGRDSGIERVESIRRDVSCIPGLSP